MLQLYAQPYDISANGFYFETVDEYQALEAQCTNAYGQVVEEFEIQFIDGTSLDSALASAWNLDQATIWKFLDAVDGWDDEQKIRFIIAVGECGYDRDAFEEGGAHVDITYYENLTIRGLAEQYVDEGLFGEIPDTIARYIDYDAIARDLAMDYSEIRIGNNQYLFYCN